MRTTFFLSLLFFTLYAEAKPNRSVVYRPKSQSSNYQSPSVPSPTYSQPGNYLAQPTLVAKTSLFPESPAPARFRLGPAMGMQHGLLGFGATAELTFSTGSPFFLGVQSGYLKFEDGAEVPEWLALVPVMATFVYRFNLSSGAVHPYLGVAIGVSLANGTMEEAGTITPVEGTQTDLMVTGRPGVEFQLSRVTSFFLEPQLGLFQSQFIFMPQAGFAFDF